MGQFLARGVSVTTSFDYVSFDNEPGADLNTPRFWEGDPTESTLRTPTWVKTPNVTVRDIRPEQDKYYFSKDGFQLLGIPTAHSPHPDHQDEVQAYLGETAAHVRKLLNASQAFVFDYRVIRSPASPEELSWARGPGNARRTFHKTPCCAWRPLNLPVEDMPLALCAFPSLDLSDVASSHFHGGPGYIAETYVLRHNKNQKWVWFGQQRPDELLVFKNFDSEPGNSPRCEFHTFAILKTS
ncbi:uncharacterized protein E0L32_000125 [Thyridium curvatum]|uniref:Uncharacterized protein n=1 Tax=Thyridium curvatum TaxID=1093900 RepID=A0A507BFP7_9PEZI|nr:uncharacterized protein E0L32_000125 [Thyridium curvatum]TPX15791.1 hypothetical protein E0L32_000125 [Thyridium curvatum]